ncbi:MAG: hypothetical protein R3A12_19360 [Ignavibacteria bacterium]
MQSRENTPYERVNFLAISLVGYTNAGNQLYSMRSQVRMYMLKINFATLDTSTKVLQLLVTND